MFAFIGAVVVFAVTFAAIPVGKLKPSWVSASGKPTPRDFLYAMFPVDDAVPICDSSGGLQVATLARAMMNSQREIDAGGWVAVQSGEETRWVQLNRLSYLPAPDSSVDYFASFAAYVARHPEEYRSASLELHPGVFGVTTAWLHLKQDEHWQDFFYDISAGRATPREMYSVFGPGEALGDIGRFLTALVAAIVFRVLAGMGAFVLAMTKLVARRHQAVGGTPPHTR